MPCTSGPMPGDLDHTEWELEEATKAACELAKLLTPKQLQAISGPTAAWIKDHNERDRRREAEELRALELEALKRQAKNKLTLAERQALGIY